MVCSRHLMKDTSPPSLGNADRGYSGLVRPGAAPKAQTFATRCELAMDGSRPSHAAATRGRRGPSQHPGGAAAPDIAKWTSDTYRVPTPMPEIRTEGKRGPRESRGVTHSERGRPQDHRAYHGLKPSLLRGQPASGALEAGRTGGGQSWPCFCTQVSGCVQCRVSARQAVCGCQSGLRKCACVVEGTRLTVNPDLKKPFSSPSLAEAMALPRLCWIRTALRGSAVTPRPYVTRRLQLVRSGLAWGAPW